MHNFVVQVCRMQYKYKYPAASSTYISCSDLAIRRLSILNFSTAILCVYAGYDRGCRGVWHVTICDHLTYSYDVRLRVGPHVPVQLHKYDQHVPQYQARHFCATPSTLILALSTVHYTLHCHWSVQPSTTVPFAVTRFYYTTTCTTMSHHSLFPRMNKHT